MEIWFQQINKNFVMKNSVLKTILGSLVFVAVFSCKKDESALAYSEKEEVSSASDYAVEVSDSISSVPTMKVKDKQFIKSAQVNMEVKGVYDATISIEKLVKDLGGFVTKSNLQSNVVSEETYNTSDENAVLVRKFQTENQMQVRIPMAKLGEFLSVINDKKLFLYSRNISAEDVTSNIKLAELEAKRNAKTAENIAQLKINSGKVKIDDENMSEANQQKIASLEMTDNLQYSDVDLYLKEPKLRIAEIAVNNIKNIDNKYKFSFFYDVKNAFVEGFYLMMALLVFLVRIWFIIVIGGVIFYFYKRRKKNLKAKSAD